MRYTTFFVIALVVVSGFIAYFGDLLGRKMGKKRLTLFNLRPRYTAIVVTTITGMLISALALILFMSINSEFRNVLWNGQQILQKNNDLLFENSKLTHRNLSLVKSGFALVRQVAQRQKEVDAARKVAAAAKSARDKALTAVKELKKEIAARKTELAELKTESNITKSELANKTRELAGVRGDLARAQGDLKLAEATRRRAEASLREVQAKLDHTQTVLNEKEAELKAAEAGEGQFAFESATQRSREPIFLQGEEIVRGTISPSQSEFGLRSDLTGLLEQASQKALTAGATKIGDNKRAVIVVFPQRFDIENKHYAVIVDDEPSFVDKALHKIATGRQDVMVQLICAVNTFKGDKDQVPVELRLYPNYLIYPSGDRIDHTVVDGSQSEARILLTVTAFLQKQVAKSAVQKGIIPVASPSRRSVASGDPSEQVEELMSAVQQIKAVGGRANVELFATRDIQAVDSINTKNAHLSVTKTQ